MLEEEFLKPLGMTQGDLASRIGVSVQTVNMIVNGRRAVTIDMARRLGRLFQMSAEFWMNGQLCWDLYHEQHSPRSTEIEKIEPLPLPDGYT